MSIITRQFIQEAAFNESMAAIVHLEYWNNFLTIEGFASYYGISEALANNVINLGRSKNHRY